MSVENHKIKRNCLICGKSFATFLCRTNNGRGKYCSTLCCYEAFKKREPLRKGKHHSLETKKKIGLANFGKNLGVKHHNWKGGRIVDKFWGYAFIRNKKHPFQRNNYIAEHRFVVEKKIGRYLLPKEIVHHLGEKDNNCPHKLMAFVSNSAHRRFHKDPNNVKPEEIIFDGRRLLNECKK